MNSFLSQEEIAKIGLKSYGQNVYISRHASIYSPEKIAIGDNVRIDDFCILSGIIEIGSCVHIAAYSAIYGGDKGVFISDYANISSRVSVYSVSDDYSGNSMTNPMIPAEYKSVKSDTVRIEKHVIIGSTSVVMPGVTLAEGSAFGAFSFITHNSEPWTINVGIPSVKIKNRNKNIIKLEQMYMSDLRKLSFSCGVGVTLCFNCFFLSKYGRKSA